MSPINSSYVGRQDIDMFSMLENDVAKYASLGELILIGDFKARTSCEQDFIDNDGDNTHIPVPDQYVPDTPMPRRENHDKLTNIYGKKLLDIIYIYVKRVD